MAIDINEILNTEPELSRIADRARRRLKVMSIDAAYVKAKREADHYIGMMAAHGGLVAAAHWRS